MFTILSTGHRELPGSLKYLGTATNVIIHQDRCLPSRTYYPPNGKGWKSSIFQSAASRGEYGLVPWSFRVDPKSEFLPSSKAWKNSEKIGLFSSHPNYPRIRFACSEKVLNQKSPIFMLVSFQWWWIHPMGLNPYKNQHHLLNKEMIRGSQLGVFQGVGPQVIPPN